MNFGSFLGNERLKEGLSAALGKNRLSHCYLITGPKGSGKKSLALLLAAAMQCREKERPCLRCTSCRKVLSGIHPDVITVEKQKDRKTLGVDTVRDICADLYIRPNEGEKKIYIFPDGKEITPQAQNALLKGIEEPPSYGVFLFLADQADRLLPTIRSRCAELKLSPLPADLLERELSVRCGDKSEEARREAAFRSGGYLGQALELLQQEEPLLPQTVALLEAFCKGEAHRILSAALSMERMKREQLLVLFSQCRELFCYALGAPALHPQARALAESRSRADLLAAADAVSYGIKLLQANVSPAHTCGALAILLDIK